MKRLTYLVVVWWMMFLTASAGCGKATALSPEAAAVQGQAAVQTIRGEAAATRENLAGARLGVLAAADTVGAASRAAADLPDAAPWAGRLDQTAVLLTNEVRPRIEESLRSVETIHATTADVLPLVSTVTDLAEERDHWQKEAAREKERADSAVRKWLLITAAGGFAGVLASVALFVWLSRKAGLVVGIASLVVFALSVALYRWFEWFAWGGLALIGLAVAALGYGLYKNRHAFATLVQGGEGVKAAFADGIQYTKDQIGALFNQVHAAAQADAGGGVEEMVQDVKSDGGTPAGGEG